MALLDDINRLLRDHTGYTGDGQGGSGPLPVGDRSTARFPINKRDLRELLIGIAQTMGDPGALQDIIDELGDKADIANTTKSFHTRAAAVSAGQTALPDSLGMILVDEGDYYTVRGPNQTDDDPLFATAPRWGVRDRIPTQAVVDALQAVVDGKADLASSGKMFSSRATAVSAGQDALPAALGLIVTIEGGNIVLRGASASVDDPLFDDSPQWGVLARGARLSALDGKADLASSGKMFSSRATAVSAGQDALPAALGLIVTIEGGVIVLRGANASSNDPLFGSTPSWGVLARAVPGAGAIATVENVGGTANVITGNLPAWATISASMKLDFTPSFENTGPATLVLPGHVENAWPIRDYKGYSLQAGALKPTQSYILRRWLSTWRIVGGGASDSLEAMTAIAAETTARENAVNAEIIARSAADTSMQSQINAQDDGLSELRRTVDLLEISAAGLPIYKTVDEGELGTSDIFMVAGESGFGLYEKDLGGTGVLIFEFADSGVLQGWRDSILLDVDLGERTPESFGAVGDGIADDTDALRDAFLSGRVLRFGSNKYRITEGIDIELTEAPVWFGNGASIIYDGPETLDSVVRVEVHKEGSHAVVEGLTFDGGLSARQSFEISSLVLGSWSQENWPTVSLVDVVGKNARSNDDSTGMVSGIVVSGGWSRATFTRVGARDIYFGPNVSYSSARSTVGLRTLSNGAYRPRSVHMRDVWAENIWNEGKGAEEQTSDGISIFQDAGGALPSGNDLIIDGYSCRNVGDRVIKLHSATRAIVSNVSIHCSADVLPFSGEMRAPAIDAQQGGVVLSNVDCFYDRVVPKYLVRNYGQQDAVFRNGSITTGINVFLAPDTPETMILLYNSVSGVSAGVGDTQVSLSNASVKGGRIRAVAQLGVAGSGACRFSASGVIADVTSAFVEMLGSTAGTSAVLTFSCCQQTGAARPLAYRSGGLDPDWQIISAACGGLS